MMNVNRSLYVTILPPLPQDSEQVEPSPGCPGKYTIVNVQGVDGSDTPLTGGRFGYPLVNVSLWRIPCDGVTVR